MLVRSILLIAFALTLAVPSEASSAEGSSADLTPQPLLTNSAPLLHPPGGIPSAAAAGGSELCDGMMLGASGVNQPSGPNDHCWAEFVEFSLAVIALAGVDAAYALALASGNPLAIYAAQCAWINAMALVVQKEGAWLICWFGDAGGGGQGRKDNMT